MCLEKIDTQASARMPDAAIRYKVVVPYPDVHPLKFYPELSIPKSATLGCGWGSDGAYDDLMKYELGVHVFLTKQDAIRWRRSSTSWPRLVVVKVEVRGPICSGHEFKEWGSFIIEVWKEMRILSQH